MRTRRFLAFLGLFCLSSFAQAEAAAARSTELKYRIYLKNGQHFDSAVENRTANGLWAETAPGVQTYFTAAEILKVAPLAKPVTVTQQTAPPPALPLAPAPPAPPAPVPPEPALAVVPVIETPVVPAAAAVSPVLEVEVAPVPMAPAVPSLLDGMIFEGTTGVRGEAMSQQDIYFFRDGKFSSARSREAGYSEGVYEAKEQAAGGVFFTAETAIASGGTKSWYGTVLGGSLSGGVITVEDGQTQESIILGQLRK